MFTDSILVSKTGFKNLSATGMAVRLNMSLANTLFPQKKTKKTTKALMTVSLEMRCPEKSAFPCLRLHLKLLTSRWRSSQLIKKQ